MADVTRITVRVEPDIYNLLRRICDDKNLSLSDCVRELLAASLTGSNPREIREKKEEEETMPKEDLESPPSPLFKDWLEMKVERETQKLARDQEELKSMVKSFCEQFPQLCRDISELKAKFAALEGEKSEKQTPGHKTVKEFMECDECSPKFIKAMADNLGEFCQRNPNLCAAIQKVTTEKPELFTPEKKKGIFDF